jgi:hypothetical protein
VISCKVLRHELEFFSRFSKNELEFEFLEFKLHSTPEKLKQELQTAIDRAENTGFDALLLGYGLCSNGSYGITARSKRLVIPKAHDCITMLLGSKESYRNYFDSHPGTYWFSPGWCEDGAQPGTKDYYCMLIEYIKQYGEDNGKYLFESEIEWLKNYNNAAYVDLGFGDTTELKRKTKTAAAKLKWSYDELKGDASLIKEFLEGGWDPLKFLIVEPGQKIAPSNDERVLKIEGGV